MYSIRSKISYSGLGSVIKFAFKCDDMSDERSSSLKLWVDASNMTRFCIYLGLFGLSLRISSFTRQEKWSEILLIIIDEEMFVWSKGGDLQNIWSMRVQDFFELRVGRVGKDLAKDGGDLSVWQWSYYRPSLSHRNDILTQWGLKKMCSILQTTFPNTHS